MRERTYRSLFAAVVFASLAVTLVGCGGSSSGVAPEPQNVGQVQGVIRDFNSGVGLGGVIVSVGGRQATSDANGQFRVTEVPIGTHVVAITPPDWLALPPGSGTIQVTVFNGQTTTLQSDILLVDKGDLPPEPPRT
jgi:hypothetical protein